MTTEELAEFLAVHLWAVLFVVTTVLLLLAWLLWNGLQRHGARMIAWFEAWLARIRPHAHRLPIPGAVHGMWRMVRRLGVQVVLGLVVAVTACLGFVEIADEIGADEDLGQFDVALSAALSRHAGADQLRIFAALTDLGDLKFLIIVVAAVALWLMFRRRWLLASAWIIATASGGLMNAALKAFFERSRPPHLHGFASAEGWSFPSGHSSGATIVYGLLAYLLLVQLSKRHHLPVAIVAMVLIVCVGSSRVILQVHYFSDVLGGCALGAGWAAAWIAGLETYRLRRSESRI